MSPAATTPAQSPFPRTSGILLHPTSLPGRHGIGDLGAGARSFVDWLSAAGIARWQVLPLVPPAPGGSPYSSPSAFALDTTLIDLDALVAEGLLARADVDAPAFDPDRIEHGRAPAWKRQRIEKAVQALLTTPQGRERVAAFRARHRWVEPYAVFTALKEQSGDKAWWQWPADLAARKPDAMKRATAEIEKRVDAVIGAQLLVDAQWRALRDYARARGVTLIGDMPIYVALDSADVWSDRAQFLLAEDGTPRAVAGVPPDAFSDTGQLWGNPLYDWARMKADGHRWWIERLRRSLDLHDVVRIDHFRAFAAYWAVPPDAREARGGQWVEGPGRSLFDDLEAALGALPVIVEDLGVITPDVEALRDTTGLPGMKVLQFAFGQGPDAKYLPHNHVPNCVVYTGTHDNDTTLGFWHSATDHVRDHVRRYLGRDGNDVVWDFIRACFSSVAHTAIVPMQDVLSLDGGARMNMPGTVEGNWAWRVRADAFHPNLSARLRDLNTLYGRAPR